MVRNTVGVASETRIVCNWIKKRHAVVCTQRDIQNSQVSQLSIYSILPVLWPSTDLRTTGHRRRVFLHQHALAIASHQRTSYAVSMFVCVRLSVFMFESVHVYVCIINSYICPCACVCNIWIDVKTSPFFLFSFLLAGGLRLLNRTQANEDACWEVWSHSGTPEWRTCHLFSVFHWVSSCSSYTTSRRSSLGHCF